MNIPTITSYINKQSKKFHENLQISPDTQTYNLGQPETEEATTSGLALRVASSSKMDSWDIDPHINAKNWTYSFINAVNNMFYKC